MHPTIKKFWEDAGWDISNEDQIGTGTVSGYKHIGGPWPISKIKTLAFGATYAFDDKWYSEEEMLRIVKLKAFL